MIDVKNASNNGMNCLNGSYPLTLSAHKKNEYENRIRKLSKKSYSQRF